MPWSSDEFLHVATRHTPKEAQFSHRRSSMRYELYAFDKERIYENLHAVKIFGYKAAVRGKPTLLKQSGTEV